MGLIWRFALLFALAVPVATMLLLLLPARDLAGAAGKLYDRVTILVELKRE